MPDLPTDLPTDLLESATPEERQGFVLARLVRGVKLSLPSPAGQRLCLRGLRLDPDSLRRHGIDDARWATRRGMDQARLDLSGASFAGADLRDADFSGADLTEADFSRASMRSAVIAGARLDTAVFAGADLSAADFTDVMAGEADFSGALAEDTRFTGARLRFANFTDALLDGGNFDRADLWGARMDGVTATNVLLRGAVMQEARLAGADLSGAKFGDAELQKVDLRGARLAGADLRGATLARADLEGADLTGASLPRVDLSTCNLRGVWLAGAWLESTRFQIEQLGDGIGEEAAGSFGPARQGYLALEQNFRSLGNPEAASWCYRKARRMGRREAMQALRTAAQRRDLTRLPGLFTRWFGDAFAEWLCDYGESLPRVFRAYLVTLATFAAFYGLTNSLSYTVEGGALLAGQPVHSPLLLVGFSFLNMCTSGVPDIGLKPNGHIVYFVSSMQYVVGVVLVGLFGYVLGNRLRR